jgi:hypothetical protein
MDALPEVVKVAALTSIPERRADPNADTEPPILTKLLTLKLDPILTMFNTVSDPPNLVVDPRIETDEPNAHMLKVESLPPTRLWVLTDTEDPKASALKVDKRHPSFTEVRTESELPSAPLWKTEKFPPTRRP